MKGQMKYYKFQQVDLNFDDAMEMLGERFVEIIRENLIGRTYPYAPGFDKERPVIGNDNLVPNPNDPNSLYGSVESVYFPQQRQLGILMNNYWEYVDRGRGKGSYVPIKPLVQWATLKGFDEPEKAAFGISKNIEKFGIRGTQFFSLYSTEQIIKVIEEEVPEQLGITVEEFFNGLQIGVNQQQ